MVSIIPSGQKSIRCCQRFCFLFFSGHVWCSTGFSVGTCAVWFVHYFTFRHHSQSLSQPSAFCRGHQLQKSTPPNDVQSLTHDLQSCTDGIKAWTCNNQLKLNEDKTETILFSTPSLSSCHCLPLSVMVGTHEILFSDKVRNLGFILDSNLTMKQHVIKICQTAYYEQKRSSSIRRYLTEDAEKQLVTSCVLSRLDYCNSLLMGTPNCVIQPIQIVQNIAARLILRAPRHQNCTPLLQQHHWLPVSERIKYKTACMCYSLITGSAPSYLSELLQLYSPSRSLRSSPDTHMLKIQRFNRKTHRFRTFSHFGPHIWNNLPQDIKHSATLSSFKSQLKTFLFSEYFS